IQDEQRRLEDERSGDRELLLLPPREIAPAPPEHPLQYGKEVEDERRDRFRATREDAKPDLEIFFNRELREYLSPLGHVPDTETSSLLWGTREQIGPEEHHLCRGR